MAAVASLALAALFAAAPASGASRGARERAAAARTACLSGEYAKGVKILSELFVQTKDPTHIFNQGRCFEQNSRYQDAIARFQEYLRVAKGLSEQYKADTQKHIDDCQSLLAKEMEGSSNGGPAGTQACN